MSVNKYRCRYCLSPVEIKIVDMAYRSPYVSVRHVLMHQTREMRPYGTVFVDASEHLASLYRVERYSALIDVCETWADGDYYETR